MFGTRGRHEGQVYKMRKYFIVLYLSLFLSPWGITSCLASSPAASAIPSPSPIETKPIEKVLTTYVRAFKKADFSLLKESCTIDYLESFGGKKRLEPILKQLQPQYKDASLTGLKFYAKSPSEIFTSFQIIGPKGLIDEMKDKWMLLKKDFKGKWKIDALLHDFNPEEGEK